MNKLNVKCSTPWDYRNSENYDTNFDFDGASRAWRANKKFIRNVGFRYLCGCAIPPASQLNKQKVSASVSTTPCPFTPTSVTMFSRNSKTAIRQSEIFDFNETRCHRCISAKVQTENSTL